MGGLRGDLGHSGWWGIKVDEKFFSNLYSFHIWTYPENMVEIAKIVHDLIKGGNGDKALGRVVVWERVGHEGGVGDKKIYFCILRNYLFGLSLNNWLKLENVTNHWNFKGFENVSHH